jgi:hypothetical protein
VGVDRGDGRQYERTVDRYPRGWVVSDNDHLIPPEAAGGSIRPYGGTADRVSKVGRHPPRARRAVG